MLLFAFLSLSLSAPNKFHFTSARQRHFKLKKSVERRALDAPEESNWYLVHFHEKIDRKSFNIDNSNVLLKNTYQLFLSGQQLNRIKDIALVKKIEPHEKIYEDGGSLKAAEFLTVVATKEYDLNNSNDYYRIIQKVEPGVFLVAIEKGRQLKASQLLSELPEVLSVTTYRKAISMNNIMTGYTQKNTQVSKVDSVSGLSYTDRYLNNLDITGKDEIVAILDTIVDFHHAMFLDPDHEVEFNKKLDHRKFVYYGYNSDLANYTRTIEDSEHGTHVAGTTAGKSNCVNDQMGTSLFDGNAPDAKILYAGHFNDVSANKLIQLLKEYNTKISTNSWGYSGGFNAQSNNMWGRAAASEPSRLFLFAAGNDYSKGNFTVCDPGGSKNVLTIGAIADFYNTRESAKLESVDEPSLTPLTIVPLIATNPWLIASFGNVQGKSDVVALDMKKLNEAGNACETINQPFVSLLYSDDSKDFSTLECSNVGNTLGVYRIIDRTNIEKYISQSKKVKITDTTSVKMDKAVAHADYSSTGPGFKGIMKPDVAAPGTRIISAASRRNSIKDHGCRTDDGNDFVFMQGTSMATPNAAGAAALIRQYFDDGKHWRSDGTKVDLDASTIRALMINSARHPTKSKTPDIFFGHGVLDLSTILPFNNEFGVSMTKQDAVTTTSIGVDQHLVATLEVKSRDMPLSVTLSYLDPTLSDDSMILIANDLDLVVTSPSNQRYQGDHLSNNDTQHLSTNEKVIIDSPEVGTYKIHVYSGSLVDDGAQKFAVVATGKIDSQFLTFTSTTECDCTSCNKGRCVCDSKHIGNHCQVTIAEGSGEYKLKAHEIKRIMLTADKIKTIKVDVPLSVGSNTQVWVANECYMAQNDYDSITTVSSLKSSVKIDEDNAKKKCIALFNNYYEGVTFKVSTSEKDNTGMIAGIVVAVVVVVAVAIVAYCCCKRKKSVGNS